MKILRPTRIERCIGCHSFSLCCARLVHQRISWSTAGIRITSSGGLSSGFEAKVCLACDPAPCAQACPTGAYTQRVGGGVKVDKELCIRCGACAEACPVDAVYLEPESNEPYVCIHCGRCVRFCPQDCLELVDSPHQAAQTDPAPSDALPGQAKEAANAG
jgi:thiosulfate reductase electron transport protein